MAETLFLDQIPLAPVVDRILRWPPRPPPLVCLPVKFPLSTGPLGTGQHTTPVTVVGSRERVLAGFDPIM